MQVIGRGEGRQGRMSNVSIHVGEEENRVTPCSFGSDELAEVLQESGPRANIPVVGVEEATMLGINATDTGEQVGARPVSENDMELFAGMAE